MPMYAFKGVANNGKSVTGVRDADSPKTLRQLLRKDGVLVTSFELSKGGKAAKEQNAKRAGLSKEVDLGGIFSGVFTVTESAAVGVAYTVIVGLCSKPRLRWKDVYDLLSHEGYEVLAFLNRMANASHWVNKEPALKAERLIREKLPANVRSRQHVWQWIADHWND